MDSRYLQDKEELQTGGAYRSTRERATSSPPGLVGGFAVAAGALMAGAAHAQQLAQATATRLSASSKWGKDDQAGASNYMTPAKVLDTVKLIQGRQRFYRIGRVYENAMPSSASASSSCAFRLADGGPVGANKLIYHDEF